MASDFSVRLKKKRKAGDDGQGMTAIKKRRQKEKAKGNVTQRERADRPTDRRRRQRANRFYPRRASDRPRSKRTAPGRRTSEKNASPSTSHTQRNLPHHSPLQLRRCCAKRKVSTAQVKANSSEKSPPGGRSGSLFGRQAARPQHRAALFLALVFRLHRRHRFLLLLFYSPQAFALSLCHRRSQPPHAHRP
ncbi:hypothetical protein HPB48_009602 [Haemaphysalis longicornis]|uniref:Uncharacterized protein n=1 Tax=Haemaphysalis longicornis TaxID=44386 RepID=A0A9J6FTX9_HAELO|nr:hypothetical protein HPB48_009602 [Haemaphysalis longicornis]